jgi:hypothetical protein
MRRRETKRLRTKNDAARETMGLRDERAFLALGAIAYWCEGTKDKIYDRRERVTFCNSDPMLIRFFLDWLTLLGVDPDRRTFRLAIHQTADVASAEAFWCDVLQITKQQLAPTTLKHSSLRTNRINRDDRYHGVMAVSVKDPREFYQHIEGWMRGAADAMARAVQAREKGHSLA